MRTRELVGMAAKGEGKKHQMSMGDAMELMAQMKKLVKKMPEAKTALCRYFGLKED